MSNEHCSRCDSKLTRPHTENANYVVASDFTEPELREVTYAMVHTELTKRRLDFLDEKFENRSRDALAAEIANPNADKRRELHVGQKTVVNEHGNEVDTADHREVGFSVPTEMFDHVRVDDPHLPEHDDDVALTYSVMEEQEVQKTGLVCSDCTEDNDEIIWGVDN